MIYAKINSDGTIAQFPYRSIELDMVRPGQPLPEGVVEVDDTSNRPTTSWKQVAKLDSVNKVGDNYVVNFNVVDRFTNDEEKLKVITVLKNQEEGINERTFAYKAKELLSTYSEFERSTWNQQRQEASAYQTNSSASTPLLSALAAQRGITVSELATKVLNNASQYDSLYGTLLGKYQKNRQILNSIKFDDQTTWDFIDSIVEL